MSMGISRGSRDRSFLFAALALVAFLAPATQSSASSSASVFLQDLGGLTASDSQTDTTTPATATLNGVVGNARADLGAGLVGAGLELPAGSPTGFYTAGASLIGNWSGSGPVGNVPLAASITLSGSIDSSLLVFSDPFWQISFSYVVGNQTVLSFGASGDSNVPSFFAFANGNDITSNIQFSTNPTNPLLTDFTLVASPSVSVSGSGFSDQLTLRVDAIAQGPLTLDMFHTVSVALTSLDPGVTFTGDDGRTIPSVPEPGTFALLAAGLGAIGWRRRG